MPAAARLADSIGHSPSMNWLLAGLLAGAAIAVAGVAIVGTGGLAAVAIVGGAAAGGAGLGEVMSTMSWAPKEVSGMIAGTCSANVFTNTLPAARAHVDMVTCGAHAGPPIPISTGSGQVFINGMPAARVDDKTSCGAVITTGSGNVFIGGGAVRTDIINFEDLVPTWVHAALLVVGAGAALVLAGPVIAVGGLVVGMAGAYAAAWAGAKAFGEGSDGQKWSAIAGGFVGGWLGAKGAPGAWNFAKRIELPSIAGHGGASGAKRVAAGAESSSAAFDGALYPPDKLRQLVAYLEKRGISVYGTNGNPRFDARWDGTGTIYLPENPTVLQVKHELSHYLDFRNSMNSAGDVKSGVQSFVNMGRLGREEAVLSRLQAGKSWQQMNTAERDFSIEYVNRLRREAGQ